MGIEAQANLGAPPLFPTKTDPKTPISDNKHETLDSHAQSIDSTLLTSSCTMPNLIDISYKMAELRMYTYTWPYAPNLT